MCTDCKKPIDIHTHIFPPKIAENTIRLLKENIMRESAVCAPSYTDATLSGLRLSMKENNIGISVVQPVLTNPKSIDSVNAFAKKLNETGDVISFAGMHPRCADICGELSKIKESGFKGIKLHPEFQDFFIDCAESIALLKEAERLKLYTVIHCGIDLGMPKPVHCPPQRLANALGEVSGKYIIAAHLGGLFMFDDVEKYLVGTPVSLDTAYLGECEPTAQLARIIHNHGSEKVIFGSDSPWGEQGAALALVRKLVSNETDYENIVYNNAAKILEIHKDFFHARRKINPPLP